VNIDFYPSSLFDKYLDAFLTLCFQEDIGPGDHTSMAILPENTKAEANLLVKDNGLIAGIDLAGIIFRKLDPSVQMHTFFKDGDQVNCGDIAFQVKGEARAILTAERLVLNFMQHLSGIATKTFQLTQLIEAYPARLLDTRKTVPGLRLLEKWAVKIGGGSNHRIGLYDMILIKDNHIDHAGGITNAVDRAKDYLKNNKLNLKIEVELRTFNDIHEVLELQGIDRVLLDNFSPQDLNKAVSLIDKRLITEASGGITEKNIREYARSNVDYISSGFLTHTVTPLDLSLKIKI